jgi:hypothetical protein
MEDEMPSLRLSVLALAAALAGCTSVKIRTEYDPKAPFQNYKTYAWLASAPGPEQAQPIRNPAIRAQVVAIVDRALQKKGLTLVPLEARPDLLVWVIGWSSSRVEVSTYGYAYGGAYVYGAYGPGVAVPVADVREYAEGTLILDLIDEKTRNLVWRGTANDTLSSPDPDVIRAAAEEATRKLVAEYPPKR